MTKKKRVYLYPMSGYMFQPGSNTYIANLLQQLQSHFHIVNRPTSRGLLDVAAKLYKTDIVYFNWIEDVPNRRFGIVQVSLLRMILMFARMLGVKIIWFVHNNLSHSNKHLQLKSSIVRLMQQHAHLILSHSRELQLDMTGKNFHVFHHPIDEYTPLKTVADPEYDLLIWGTVSPYKGITEFIQIVSASPSFGNLHVLIAGKFPSAEYYQEVLKHKPSNVTVVNKLLSETELQEYFSQSRYVLFTYNKASVLSSGALCKTLSYGKEVIGPCVGSFKELGDRNLLHCYQSGDDIPEIVSRLKNGTDANVSKQELEAYIAEHTWEKFGSFVTRKIEELYQ